MSFVGTTLRRWDVQVAVSLTLIVQMGISFLSAAAPILAPIIAADRDWDVTLIALYPTAVYGAAFLFSFRIPAILARIGGVGLSIACLVASAVGILCLLSGSPLVLLAVPLSIGFAVGAMNPASSHVLGPRISPRNAGLVMSIKQTGVPIGIMLAGTIVPILVSWLGWRQCILVLAVVAIVVSTALVPSMRRFNQGDGADPTASAARRGTASPVKRLISVPGMARFLFAAGIFGAMQHCLRTFFVVHLVSHVGLSLATAGLAFSVSQAAGVFGQVIWATASDRVLSTPLTMTLVGATMTVGAALTGFIAPDWPLPSVLVIAAIYGISAAGHFPLILGEVARRSRPGDVGAMTAAAQVCLIPLVLLGPLVFGAVSSLAGLPAAFTVLAACTLVASVISGTQRTEREPLQKE